jgi:nucleoside phosphorylase
VILEVANGDDTENVARFGFKRLGGSAGFRDWTSPFGAEVGVQTNRSESSISYVIDRLNELIREGEVILEGHDTQGNMLKYDLWQRRASTFLKTNSEEHLIRFQAIRNQYSAKPVINPYGRWAYDFINGHLEVLKFVRGHLTAKPKTEAQKSSKQMGIKADILLVTVNKHETQAILTAFKEATGFFAKEDTIDDRVYRDLGVINETRVYHALSEMGSAGPGATQQTVDKGVRALMPGAVIAIGIAFGVNEKRQRIGEILVSEQLWLYELQRAGEKIIPRGGKPHASSRLINFFKGMAQTSWEGAPVTSGLILSGEKLVDNLDYRTQLIGFEREAVGGEMEGAGVYVASLDHKVDWIVIKAICDWGDGTKAKNKTARQKAKNAADFLIHALKKAPLKYSEGTVATAKTSPTAASSIEASES